MERQGLQDFETYDVDRAPNKSLPQIEMLLGIIFSCSLHQGYGDR